MLAYVITKFAGPLMLTENANPSYMWAIWELSVPISLTLFALIIRMILDCGKKSLPERSVEPTDVYLNFNDKEDKNYIYHLYISSMNLYIIFTYE